MWLCGNGLFYTFYTLTASDVRLESDVSHHSDAKGDKRTCTKRLILGSSAYHHPQQQGEKRFVGYLQDDEGFQDIDDDEVSFRQSCRDAFDQFFL
jgi:hypothetical protein